MNPRRVPVLASGYSTDAGPGGITTWTVDLPDTGTPRARLTGDLTLGDATWALPTPAGLAVIGERDARLWLVDPSELSLIAELDLGGGLPCHAALDPSGRLLAVAHYGSGELSVVELDRWGDGPQQAARTRFEGRGPVAGRQESAHPHQVTWLDRSHLAVTDLGSDLIRILKFGPAGLEQVGAIATPAGFGPRHLVLTARGTRQVMIVDGELSGRVLVLTRTAGDDVWAKDWRPRSPVPTSGRGRSQPSALIPLDAGDLLVANRMLGTISVLAGLGGLTTWSGNVHVADEFDCAGTNPRDMTADGNRIWVAQQDDGAVVGLGRGPDGWRPDVRLQRPGATHVLVGAV